MVLFTAPPASAYCDSSLCGSPEAIAIATGTGAWADAGAVAAGATGTASALAGTAGTTVSTATLGSLLPATAAAVALGGWYAAKLLIAGPVPGALTGTPSASPGWLPNSTVTSTNGSTSVAWTVAISTTSKYADATAAVTVTAATPVPSVAGTGYTIQVFCKASATSDQPSSTPVNGVQGYLGAALPFFTGGSCGTAGFYGLRLNGQNVSALNGSQAWWYAPGNPMRPADLNPQHGILTRKLDCVNGTGQVLSQSSSITITLAADGSYDVPSMLCPSGSVSAGFGADWTPDGGTVVHLVPWTTTATWAQDVPVHQPLCLTEVCYLRLYAVAPAGSPAGSPATSCGDLAVACPDWFTDPNRAGDYECHWGPYVVQLTACAAFRKPGTIVPNTVTTTSPAPGAAGTTADLPATMPTTSGTPGTSPSPTAGPSSSDCFPSGWGALNPVEWILRPVGCALQWAFVPTTSSTTISGIRTDINGTAPAVWANAVGGMFSGINVTVGGCDGPPLHFVGFGVDTVAHPFSACAEPMASIAPKVNVLASVLLVVFGSMACIRALGSGFGWKPSAGGDS